MATPLAEERVGALGNVPELVPTSGGLSVVLRGVRMLPGRFGERSLGRVERVLLEREDGVEPAEEAPGEHRIVGGEGSSYHCGQLPSVVGTLKYARCVREFREQRARALGDVGSAVATAAAPRPTTIASAAPLVRAA
jgi:hypothetical protein